MNPSAHRPATPLVGSGTVVRVATSGTPWPGVIVREDDGTATLHVDAALLQDTAVWCASLDGHLLAPIDVMRTPSGQEAVFPLCQQRLEDLLRDRIDAGAAPAAGECVTVAVSIMRGTEEAGDTACGHWWLSEDGRPVLALGGDVSAVEGARSILSLLRRGASGALAGALDMADQAISDARTDPAAAEDALFAAAQPAPLITTVLAPARARAVATALRAEPAAQPSAMRATIARHIDADVAERVAGAGAELRERWEARASRRAERRVERAERAAQVREERRGAAARRAVSRGPVRAPLIAGIVVGAVVLGVGLLWPSDEPSSAGSSTTPALTAPDAATAAEPSASAAEPGAVEPAAAEPGAAEPGIDAEADPVTVADELLTAARACVDESCLDALRETPGRPAIDGVLGLPASERHVALVDDYGGVAVLRVSPAAPGAAPDRLLVIVEANQKWLIRDAYDVADQP